jgi:HAD superfamily hydrolase (TIGR01509 family)
MEKKSIDLVIFDHDGVIADNTEVITAKVLTENMQRAGCNILPEHIHHFTGRSASEIAAYVLKEHGFSLSNAFTQTVRHERNVLLKDNVRASEGVETLLHYLQESDIKYCIASNSSPDMLSITVPAMKLSGYFTTDNIFSSALTNGNKAELHKHVMALYKIDPSRCLVIEDSLPGISYAKAAGIGKIVGFGGASHILDKARHAEELQKAGASIVITQFSDFPYQMLSYNAVSAYNRNIPNTKKS